MFAKQENKSLVWKRVSLYPLTKRRSFSKTFGNDSLIGHKIFAGKVKMTFLVTSFSALGYLVYVNLFGNKLEIICSKTPQNLNFIQKISEFRNGLYKKTVYFPFRIMEIVYGNMFDQREFCEYKREIIFNSENENFALGLLIRLDPPSSSN